MCVKRKRGGTENSLFPGRSLVGLHFTTREIHRRSAIIKVKVSFDGITLTDTAAVTVTLS